MDETMVAAAEYASYERASSELSGPTSDVSCPSRGWTSVATTERHEPAMAVMARLPGCHVCYGKDHFLSDCPLADTDAVDVPETETPPSSQDSTVGDQEQFQ
jgi:hypothetical protein